MSINVKIPTVLQSYTSGQRSVEASGDCLADLLSDLDRRHPGLQARLVTSDGELRRFINIYVNDNDVRWAGAMDTRLTSGDVVTILPAVAGGA